MLKHKFKAGFFPSLMVFQGMYIDEHYNNNIYLNLYVESQFINTDILRNSQCHFYSTDQGLRNSTRVHHQHSIVHTHQSTHHKHANNSK